jgi:uncharacterized protein YneR
MFGGHISLFNRIGGVIVSVFSSRVIVDSSTGRVKPKTMKLVFVDSENKLYFDEMMMMSALY